MSNVEVKCPTCGKMTTIGRLVCQHCGNRLKDIQPGDLRRKRSHGKGGSAASGASGALNALVKLVVAALIIGGVALMVWPAADVGTAGTAADVASVQKKIQYLHEGAENHRAAKVTVTEQEINAFFKKLLDDNAEVTEGGGMTMGLSAMGVDVLADQVMVVLKSKAGPATVTWECTFVPKLTGGIVDPEFQSARIGHLPMVGPLKGFVANKIGSMFGDMPMEKKIWNNLSTFNISDGKVDLETLAN